MHSDSATPLTLAATRTSRAFSVVLRSVNVERNLSPWRTTGAMPERMIKSLFVRIDVEPVPKRSAPAVATATMRKLVMESLSGTSTVAMPLSFRGTRPFQSSNVSNISRVD